MMIGQKIRKKRLEKKLKHLFSYILVSVITFFLTCIWRNHISQEKLDDVCSEDDESEDEENEEDDIELSEDDVEQLLEHDFPNWDYETVGDENSYKKRRLEL